MPSGVRTMRTRSRLRALGPAGDAGPGGRVAPRRPRRRYDATSRRPSGSAGARAWRPRRLVSLGADLDLDRRCRSAGRRGSRSAARLARLARARRARPPVDGSAGGGSRGSTVSAPRAALGSVVGRIGLGASAARPRARPLGRGWPTSLRMSMRQPVSLAARRAFWPSRPMASESIRSGTVTAAMRFSSSMLDAHDLGRAAGRWRRTPPGRPTRG